MALDKLLEQLGFSQNEAKVYLSALKTGLNSAQNIAKEAVLQRTTTYSVLKVLTEKGLVAKSKEKGKTRFLAEPPDKLLALANTLNDRVKRSLPEFEALYNQKENKPKILFYEGAKSIQEIYDDTLREKPKEILEWNTNAYFEYPEVDKNYIQKRVAAGIGAKRIAGVGSMWDSKHRFKDASELADTLIVPKDKFWPGVEINIYNNNVAFLNYAEKMSIIIESPAIAEAMKQVYKLSWLGAETIRTN
ncbi:MAG: helix-turn-helix domain-containing protein [Patescibacteria group bacterium]|jgi:sugar-specific transcriptional regulator TrmB